MKKNTPLIPWPIGLALAGLLLFGAPLQSLADCNTILGFQNGDFENWTPGASTTCSTVYPPLNWTIYYRSNTICLERVTSGVEHGTYYLYEVCALRFLGGVYQDFACNPGSVYRVTGWVKNVHTDCTGTVKITTDTSTLTGDPQTDFDAATQLYQQNNNATWTYFDTATGVRNVTATGKTMRLWLDAASSNNKSSPNRVQAYDNVTVTKVSDPVPTQLGFSGLSASGWAGQPFSVTVQAQDASGYPQCVTSDTTITLSKASGGGTLSGTLTGVIPSGASSVTISDPDYDTAGTMTLTATATAGMTGLGSVTSGTLTFSTATMTGIRWATNSANWDASTTNWVNNSAIPVAYADGDAVQFEDSQSGTSPITVTMSSTYNPVSVLVNNSTKVFTITSPGIGGTTALTKQGTGSLTLTGPNPYTGTTELGGGTLVATTDATALGAGALTLDTPSTILELDNDTGLNFGRNTTVSASMTINSGRLTSGAGVTHSLGTLSIGANQLSVAAGQNVASGTAGLAFAPATQTGAAVYDLGAGTLLTLASLNKGGFSSTFQNAGSAAVTGPLSGSGGITVNSATLYLGNTAGTSTSSGAVSVTGGGVLDLGADFRSIGSGAGDVTLNGGTLQTEDAAWLLPCAGSGDTPRNLIIGANGGTINVNASSSQVVAYNGTISGSTLTKAGQGEFQSYGVDNTFNKLIVQGSVTGGVNRGMYTAGSGGGGGRNTSFGAVPAVATQDAITLSNATLNLSGPSLSLDAKQGITLETGGNGTNGLSAASGVTLTIPGVIAGTGELRTGTGVTSQGGDYIYLSGANTFSGNIRFRANNTYLDNVNALQNATLDCDGNDDGGITVDVASLTLGGLSGGRGWSPGAAVLLNVGNNNQSTTYSGNLYSGSLTKIGIGTLTLSGAKGYAGDTTVSSGTLALSTGFTFVNSPNLTIAGNATLSVSGMASGLTLLDTQTLKASGNGSSGTIATATGNGLTLGANSPLQFTAYDGSTAPLTVSSATGGSLTLAAGNPVTVTVARSGTPLAIGSYRLIAKSGSASVAGTAPTAVTVNGDGKLSGASATLRITAGELWLDIEQPTLTATPVGSALVVSWTNPTATYLLETNTSVVNPAGWGLDVNPVNLVGGMIYVTNPMTVSNLFFRLQSNP